MNPLSITKFSATCLSYLEKDGMAVEFVRPSKDIEDEAKSIGKEFVTPTLSSAMNTFTYESSFWITLREAGQLRAVMGMRYDELGSEPIGRYWQRAYKRQYKADVFGHLDILTEMVGGNLVYMGDLFFHPDIRGSSARLMSFVHLAHCLCFIQWKQADYIYAFHRRADVLRGKTDQYGFGNRIPNPLIWKGGPAYRSSHEYLAILSRSEFDQKAEYYSRFPSVFLGR
jgi:hypothetical protein